MIVDFISDVVGSSGEGIGLNHSRSGGVNEFQIKF